MADIQNYIAEWKKSKQFVYGYTRDFKDLDTIANAQYPRGSAKKPNVGDTTIAGTIRQMMRRAVKTPPVVSVAINGSKQTEQALICRYLVNNCILNPVTFGKGFINTIQIGGRGALTRGFNVFQVKATKMYGEFGVTPTLIHFSDIGIEPGVQDINLSNYWYVRTQFTPTKLKGIYKKEKKNKNTTWNVRALKALIDAGPDGSGETEYAEWLIPSQQGTDIASETYTLITRYSRDPSDDIIDFSPTLSQELRTRPNRSKFGYPRVVALVIDAAELSPFGDSRVRLASPNQNLMMALRQNVATTWLYNSDPAVYQLGTFIGSTALKSGARLRSTDPQAKIGVITLDTSTSQQYDKLSEGIGGQILTMLGYNPSSNLGSLGQSKTGIGAQTQRMTMDDASQEITNIITDFIKQYIISALDVLLSEQEGKGILYVDDETRDDIKELTPGRFPNDKDPNALGINWNELYDYIKKIDVDVDTTITKDALTKEKRADLQDALTVMSQTSDPSDPVAQERVRAVEDEFLGETIPDMSLKLQRKRQSQSGVPQGAPGQQPAGQQVPAQQPPAQKPPSESINFKDAAAVAPRAGAAMLEQAGLPSEDLVAKAAVQDQQAAQAITPTTPQPPQ